MKISIEEITKLKYATDEYNNDRVLDRLEISEFSGTKAELLAVLEKYRDGDTITISPIIKEELREVDYNPPYNPCNPWERPNPWEITCSPQRPEGAWCGGMNGYTTAKNGNPHGH